MSLTHDPVIAVWQVLLEALSVEHLHLPLSSPSLAIMPAARTQKSMRQTTLSFGKPKPGPQATSDDSASSSSPASSSSSSSSPSPSDDSQVQTYAVALDFDSSSQSSSVSPSPPPPKAKAKPRPATKPAFDADGRSTTDVLLTIKPEFTKLIAQRKKNHEYRKYKLKESVCRLWLYETAPTSAITCVVSSLLVLSVYALDKDAYFATLELCVSLLK